MDGATRSLDADHTLTDCLDKAVESTFGMILGESPQYCDDGAASSDHSGVVGIIAVVGDVSWSLSVGFSPESATKIAEQFAGCEFDYESEDMCDVIGELANVLAGDVVAALDELGIKVQMSLPSVARASNLQLTQPGAVQSLRRRYTTSFGDIVVGLAIGKS
ncbi:MAG: chemotaxis protein CheX [Armatimonadota bacterium]|nr:chemotaxis protein CheX [Armatimonadota bacterium]